MSFQIKLGSEGSWRLGLCRTSCMELFYLFPSPSTFIYAVKFQKCFVEYTSSVKECDKNLGVNNNISLTHAATYSTYKYLSFVYICIQILFINRNSIS